MAILRSNHCNTVVMVCNLTVALLTDKPTVLIQYHPTIDKGILYDRQGNRHTQAGRETKKGAVGGM